MSEIAYNDLVFEVSERLEALGVLNRLLFMCRGKLASGSEGNIQDVRSLFIELEERNYLGIDRMEVMKDLLKRLKEWNLFGKVKKLESERKDYIGLLEQMICALEEANDLERLIAVCSAKTAVAIEGNVRDVRTLLKELENYNCLGVDRLGPLKEILKDLEKESLLKEVEEFEKRRCEDEEFERRNARAAAVVTSVRATGERVVGAVSVHCTFRNISGALLLVGTGLVLRRCSSLKEFVEAFREAILPAANALRAISEGSVCFTVQAEHGSALEALWQRYRDGTLQKDLQKFLVTDEIKQLADGGEVTVGVYIDEQEFKSSLSDLKNVEQQGPVGLEIEQSRYLDQERFVFVEDYLKKVEDARSMTTERSDSGMPGTHSASSELETEETNDATGQVFLKDLNKAMTGELSRRLEKDPVALGRFCQVFGLDHSQMLCRRLPIISELFPDTPVKLLKDVFKALQLYDLEDLLEKGKLCTLRPTLPFKEIEKLPHASNRPTNFYSRVEVLIFHGSKNAADDAEEKLGSFFRMFDSRSEVTSVTFDSNSLLATSNDLLRIQSDMRREEQRLAVGGYWKEGDWKYGDKKELVLAREQWTKERKPKILMEIKEKEEEMQKSIEQFEIAVTAVVNKWTRMKDMESTLFIIYDDCTFLPYDFAEKVRDVFCKTLALIPDHTKVLLAYSGWVSVKAVPQTLLIDWSSNDNTTFLATMLEILHKRWATLDVIAIMQEVQRTLPLKMISQPELVEGMMRPDEIWSIHDSLTCLPRLKKAHENDS